MTSRMAARTGRGWTGEDRADMRRAEEKRRTRRHWRGGESFRREVAVSAV